MPGHFTHICTVRRIAEHLFTNQFPYWPLAGSSLLKHDPKTCGCFMRKYKRTRLTESFVH